MGRIFRLVALLVILTGLGTAGFYFLEGWDFLDSLYMSVITLTTVGYRDEVGGDISDQGKIFVILYLILGFGLFFYAIAEVARLLLETQLRDWFKERKMTKEIQNLEDHYIICGFGGMGTHVAHQLQAKGLNFVVVDRTATAIKECNARNWPWILGDATDDQVLRSTGIHSARGLATVLPSDADNVYVVLSARILAPTLQIIAKASDESVVSKLENAGANRVVSLYATGASRISQLLTNPKVADFLEIFGTGGAEVDMAEVEVTEESPFRGKSLAEAGFRERGVIIVGIRHGQGEILVPPPSQEAISSGDILIVAGRSRAVQDLLSTA